MRRQLQKTSRTKSLKDKLTAVHPKYPVPRRYQPVRDAVHERPELPGREHDRLDPRPYVLGRILDALAAQHADGDNVKGTLDAEVQRL